MTDACILTFGCALNQSDSERIGGILAEAGFGLKDTPEEAEVVVLNSCCVLSKTEQKVLSEIGRIRSMHKPVVVAGCMAKAMPEKLKGLPLVGPDDYDQIVSAVEEAMHRNCLVSIAGDALARLDLPHRRKNPAVEIIPIAEGCMSSCSYCIVPRARGKLHSYDPFKICRAVRDAAINGAKEVWLTAQDTGCYGHDLEGSHDLVALLGMLKKISGDFRIRVGMMNPNHARRLVSGLLGIFGSDRFFRFLHVPVQSGSQKVLESMQRGYSAEDFETCVKILRERYPDITIATDVICGFPKETQEDWKQTVSLIERTRPDVLNISGFSPRPGTPAARMKKLSTQTVKDRTRHISSLFEWIAFERNRTWRGWEGDVIVESRAKEGSVQCRNHAYKPVILPGSYSPGQKVRARVVHSTCYDLRAIELPR